MIIAYALLTAVLIVSGQALWKSAVSDIPEGAKLVSLPVISGLLSSPKLILGVFVYGIATLLYIYFLGKYNYFQLQSIVVGSSLVLTLLFATVIFNERPSVVNIIGVGMIVLGSIFVVTR